MPPTHTRLLVEHFAECFRFYRDIIGMTLNWGDENSGYADFESEDGQVALALFLRQAMSDVLGTGSLPVNPPGQDRFMLIFGVADVNAEVQRIRQQGVEFVLGPKDFPGWGYRGAYLRDPDGHLVELFTGLPEEQWTEGLREADEKYKPAPDAG
jgi:lactoylglutathione lyase